MSDARPVVVVGSGPAGVSVAWPLVEAGLPVLMLDAGAEAGPSRVAADRSSLASLRTDFGTGRSWRHLIGPTLSGLRNVGYASPKLRTSAAPGFGEDYAVALGLDASGFRAVGAFSPGGLSAVWGAVVCAFQGEELDPRIDAGALDESYRRVAARIGINGSDDDPLADYLGRGLPLQPPLPVSSAAAALLAKKGPGGDGLTVGRLRTAILTRDLGDRNACDLGRACMWGCGVGAIYNSADELPALWGRDNFTLRWRAEVVAVESDGSGPVLRLRDGEKVAARAVILAAGVLSTTRLVLAARGGGQSVPLLNNPAVSFALLSPSRLGRPLAAVGHGAAQLGFRQIVAGKGELFGMLYDADTMSAVDIMSHMPFSRPGAAAVARRLLPAVMLGLGYLPGAYSRNRVTLAADGGLKIEGETSADCAATMAAAGKALRRSMARLGAHMLPGSFRPYPPGAEVHYAGTLARPEDSTADGAIVGLPGVVVADASVIGRLPAKTHTFTAMANADRIGRLWAARLSGV